MSRSEGRGVDAVLALILFGCGVVLCLHYGRRGFMPLDQSIVWDAGWRILDGQVPFRDFVSTTNLAPGVLQAAVFRVLGVTWLAYCLHAAVFNGLFAGMTYWLLRLHDLPPAAAAVFGAAAAVFFYPPFGVPYGDQHSFFFGLAALVLSAQALRLPWPRDAAFWALVPAALLLGYLSKPIPVAFLLPAIGLVAFWPGTGWLRRVGIMAGGAAAVLLALAAALAVSGADLTLAWDYLVRLPRELGAQRASSPAFVGERLQAMLQLGGRSGILFPRAALLGSSFGTAAAVTLALIDRRRGFRDLGRLLRPLAVGVLLWGGTAMFVGVTRNQARNGHALLPVVLGLLAATLAGVAVVAARSDHRLAPGLRKMALVGAAGLMIVVAVDATRFNASVNATRMVHDTRFDPSQAAEARQALPEALRFLQWSRPPAPYSPAALARLVRSLAAEPAPVLLVSDSLLVYGLAGKPSLNPNLWYHPGVSMPRADDRPRIERLERLFLHRLEELRPGLVVFDPPPGPSSFELEVLPRVHSFLIERRCGTSHVGPFPVWQLCWKGPGDPERLDRPDGHRSS